MSDKITVINRTGSTISVGIGQNGGGQPGVLWSPVGSADIPPGESTPVTVVASNGNSPETMAPFDVGYLTASSSNPFKFGSSTRALITHNVYLDSIVTITSTVSTKE